MAFLLLSRAVLVLFWSIVLALAHSGDCWLQGGMEFREFHDHDFKEEGAGRVYHGGFTELGVFNVSF